MKIKLVKPCHIDWVKHSSGAVLDVDAGTGEQLAVAGYAVVYSGSPMIETSTIETVSETAEAPARGRGRRK
jgi:hypothetical protein